MKVFATLCFCAVLFISNSKLCYGQEQPKDEGEEADFEQEELQPQPSSQAQPTPTQARFIKVRPSLPQQAAPAQHRFDTKPQQFEIRASANSNKRTNDDEKESSTWIPIIKYNKEQSEDGSYKTNYETGNNIIYQESGYLKDFSDDNPNGVLVQKGQYSYESPDGQIVNVEYTADENGFHATGDHIPTSPPIPEEIQKGLDQIYAGIRLNQQRSAERAKTDPEYAKQLEERAKANALGLYISE